MAIRLPAALELEKWKIGAQMEVEDYSAMVGGVAQQEFVQSRLLRIDR